MKNTDSMLLVSLLLTFCGALSCVVLFFYQPIAAGILLAVLAGGAIALALTAVKLKKRVEQLLTGLNFEESETRYTLSSLPWPTFVLSGKTVVWVNEAFSHTFCTKENAVLRPVTSVLTGFELNRLASGTAPYRYSNAGGTWLAVQSSAGKSGLSVAVLCDVAELDHLAQEYQLSRPVCMVMEIDAYDTLISQLKESQRAKLSEGVSEILEHMAEEYKAMLQKITENRYLVVLEHRYLDQLKNRKFDILDKVRKMDDDQEVTLSIGIGCGTNEFAQCREWAFVALEMALGRGGDQAAIKEGESFEFFGGVSKGVEKQSKVKSRIISRSLTEKIKASDSVLIMGHRFSDLDSLGSAYGVLHMCRMCNVPAAIVFDRSTTLAGVLADRIAQQDNDCFMAPDDVLEAITPDTMLIVVDTCLAGRVESRDVLERCSKIAVIDHHRKAVGAIENAMISYQEPYASSACELVSEMLMYMGDKTVRPDVLTAEALLSGIVLDTRNFALHTGVRTFEAAAFLRRMGAKTENTKELLAATPDEYRAKARLAQNAELYRGCAISVMEAFAGCSQVSTSIAANDLMTIQGVKAAFVATAHDGNVNISARSMGEINVQVVLEALGGGGHLTMAGAQLKNSGVDDASRKLRAAIDAFLSNQADDTSN